MRRSLTLPVLVLALASAAFAQPAFTKAFLPNTIGPGSASTLEYTIVNASGAAVTGLSFSDSYPAGVTIASPSNVTSSCTGGGGRDEVTPVIDAPEGSSTLAYSNGAVGAGATCTVRVDVTITTPGTVTSTSGPLTSSAGNSGSATATLTVTTDRPGFSASVSPSAVTLGGRSTVTYLLDNTQNTGAAYLGGFTHDLPTGMSVGSPSNATTTCGGATVSASPGSGTVTLQGNLVTPLSAGSSCTVSVDVFGNAIGQLANATGELTTAASVFGILRSSGVAGLSLDVFRRALVLTKSFSATPVAPGGTVTMSLDLRNVDRGGTAVDLAFSDDLEATLSGLVATGLPVATCGGTLSTPDGGSTIAFSGGTLASGASCSISVTLAVPTSAPTGSYTNTTSPASGVVNGEAVLGDPGVADLVVATAPILTTEFTDDPAIAGGTVTLAYSVTNTSATSSANSITFGNDLAGVFGETFTATLPPDGFCGMGATMTLQPNFPGSARTLTVSGASLDPGASCSFSLVVGVPESQAGGTYTNATGRVSATIDDQTVIGNLATDDLVIVDVPELTTSFPDGAVAPGGATTLRFSLAFGPEAGSPAADLAFTDDLDAMIPGLVATGLPLAACGGTLSSPDFGSTLEFDGGSLGVEEVCTFDVSVDVPASAPSGVFTHTTSPLTGTVDGSSFSGPPASADLLVTALTFSQSFVDDPVEPGGMVTLAYALSNGSATDAATDVAFSHDLSQVLSGLASTSGTLTDGCGAGSQISGTSTIVFSGGSLAPGAACTVSIDLAVPAGTTPDDYSSTTSQLSATIGGTSAVLPPATDILVVTEDSPPVFTKTFSPTTVAEGSGSTVVLTIDNGVNTGDATSLDVTDALPAGLTVGTPANAATTCVGGTLTAASGSTSVTYSGGSVAGGATCTVSFDVSAAGAGTYTNTTENLTSSLGNSGSASATLTVRAVQLSASKTATILDDDGDGQADPGESIRYTISLVNADTRESVALTFDDTPDENTAVVPGSVTTSQGTVSTESPSVGVEVGTIPPGATATITFDVLVDMPLASGVVEVCNQGTVTGNDLSLLTDDPSTPGLDGPTCVVTDPNEPPVADAGEDQTLECAAPAGTPVTLDGTASSDPDEDELTYVWTGDFPEGGGSASGAEPTVTLAVGERVISLTVADPSGETDSDEVTITIEDTLAPVITLNGDAEITLVRFSGPYSEAGATAEDVCEGPVAVAIDGTVDTTVPGETVITYTAVDGAGNAVEATRTVTVIDDPNAIVSPYLVLVDRHATFFAQARTEGDIHANEKIDLKTGLRLDDGGPSLHLGDLTAVDDIAIHDRQRVDGDVRADRVDLKNGAVVTGTVIQSAAPVVSLPTVSVSASGMDVDVANDGSLTLGPGSYGKLTVGKNATLSLLSGVYTFEEIKLEEGARVEVTLTTGPTQINVEKKIDAKDGVVIVPLPFGEADSRYLVFRVAGNKVDFGKDAQVAAQIVAPEAKVTFDGSSRYVGAIIANDLALKDEAVALFVTVVGPAPLVAAGGTSGSAGTAEEPGEDVSQAPPPDEFSLAPAYPNPLRQIATVRFGMPVAATVRVSVYDALGREVARLVDGVMEAGRHQTTFVSDGLPSGTYLLRMSTSEGFAHTQPITIVR